MVPEFERRPEVETSDVAVERGADGPPSDWQQADVPPFQPGESPGVTVERGRYPSEEYLAGSVEPLVYDPASESHVELVLREGTHTLTLRREWEVGDKAATDVLDDLTRLAKVYLDEGRLG